MLCTYCPDLPGLCEHLRANGVNVPPINFPPYMPGGEIMLKDPDGYSIIVGHWGPAEQQAWEKRLRENA